MRDRFDAEPGTQRNPRPEHRDLDQWIVLAAKPKPGRRVFRRHNPDKIFTIKAKGPTQ